jgi:hypothetical protein
VQRTLIRAQWDQDRQEWWVTRDQLQEDGTAKRVASGFSPSLHVISEWLTEMRGSVIGGSEVTLQVRC